MSCDRPFCRWIVPPLKSLSPSNAQTSPNSPTTCYFGVWVKHSLLAVFDSQTPLSSVPDWHHWSLGLVVSASAQHSPLPYLPSLPAGLVSRSLVRTPLQTQVDGSVDLTGLGRTRAALKPDATASAKSTPSTAFLRDRPATGPRSRREAPEPHGGSEHQAPHASESEATYGRYMCTCLDFRCPVLQRNVELTNHEKV